MLRAIILDMDGTLCESEEVHRRAFNQAFAEVGLTWDWDRTLYGRLLAVKGGVDRLRHYMETVADPKPAGDLGPQARELHLRKTALFKQLVAAGVPPRPGVVRLMDEARGAGIRLALVTSASVPTATALVQGTLGPDGLDAFAAVCTGDKAAHNKPAPDLYRMALKELGLPPEACIAIEDDRAGLNSATGAGVAVVATPSGYSAGEDLSGARAVVSDLGDPGAPCRAIAGPAPDGGVVDVAWLARVLSGGGAARKNSV
jgi:HAD superfamily hydrolase (TIGR01509 family)